MKKLSLIFLIIIGVLTSSVSVGATSRSYSWYCAHCKGHVQPLIDDSISFIEKYDGFYIDKKHSDSCDEKVIYLTFDAGYNNGNIDRILDVLKRENVTAAFFVLGHLIDKETALVERMFNEGHLVCNHTFSHKAMVNVSEDQFKQEICKLEEKCVQKTGRSLSKFYRPPEGRFDESSLLYARSMGYKTVFWSFAYDDWDNNRQMNAEKAKNKIIENLHNGEIMLLHPTSSTNAEILGDVIKEARRCGYSFGRLDEIII